MGDYMDDDQVTQWEGVVAPELTLTTLNGETFTLSELKGKRVIIDIWATWCPPCIEEIPHFDQLREEFTEDELIIVGLSDEDIDTVLTFLDENDVDYPMAAEQIELPDPYGAISAYPTTFFIDRNGVIQTVIVGYEELDSLREYAMADDFEGKPLLEPAVPQSELLVSETPLIPELAWTLKIRSATSLAIGDWNQDGIADVLVSDQKRKLHVISDTGSEIQAVSLPATFQFIEFGIHATQGPRLLGYDTWGNSATVVDRSGKKLWAYKALMGINGAHWGDLDGDGTDEMIVGMNGGGGLHGVSAKGKKLWKRRLGNVWNQAVISANDRHDALVVATEAGGTIRIFDGDGKAIDTLEPGGAYFSPVIAAEMDLQGTRQILAIGDNRIFASDLEGNVQWSTPVDEDNSKWVDKPMAFGDLNGDGTNEWLFVTADNELVIVSPDGEKLGALENAKGIEEFAVLPLENGSGLLIVQYGNRIEAYRMTAEAPLVE